MANKFFAHTLSHRKQVLNVLLLVLACNIYFNALAQPPISMSRLNVQLMHNNASSVVADGFVVVFAPGFLQTIGPEDSYKFTNSDENMAIMRNGTALSIEGRPNVIDYDTIPVKIWQYRQTSYKLRIFAANFTNAITAVLKDNYLHQDFPIDLTVDNLINYNLVPGDTASYSPNRLCIVFLPKGSLPLGITSVNGMSKNNGIQLDWSVANNELADRYTIERSANSTEFTAVAQVTPAGTSGAAAYTWYDNEPLRGNNYYRIKVTGKSGEARYSSLVKVNNGKIGPSGISIFPNPVVNGKIGLQMEAIPAAQYRLVIANHAGQVVYSQQVQHSGGSASRMVHVPALGRGVFTLLLLSGKEKYSARLIAD